MCPDCQGSGKYIGFTTVETCRTCGGTSEIIPLDGLVAEAQRPTIAPEEMDYLKSRRLAEEEVVAFLGDTFDVKPGTIITDADWKRMLLSIQTAADTELAHRQNKGTL